MIEILHYLNDPKLWELWYTPYYGLCRIYIINRIYVPKNPEPPNPSVCCSSACVLQQQALRALLGFRV